MRGRTAVFEVMPVTDRIRDAVMHRQSSSFLRGQALADGMMTMQDSGIRKVLDGITSPEEIARVLYAEA
jgi:type IV pilus assembly protein PilB